VAGSASSQALAAAPIRILVVGDSFVVGEGVSAIDTWPAQLVGGLSREGYSVEIEVIAETGWTSQRLAREVDRAKPPGPYDVVIICVGINDHFNQFGTRQLESGVNALFDEVEPLVSAAGDIVALSIVDWRVTPRGLMFAGSWRDRDVGPYNETLAAAVAVRGGRIVDVTGVSLDQADDASLIANDGLHASGFLYTRWVDLMLPVVIDVIG
jgi:lysophospholipase L1-like esterase